MLSLLLLLLLLRIANADNEFVSVRCYTAQSVIVAGSVTTSHVQLARLMGSPTLGYAVLRGMSQVAFEHLFAGRFFAC